MGDVSIEIRVDAILDHKLQSEKILEENLHSQIAKEWLPKQEVLLSRWQEPISSKVNCDKGLEYGSEKKDNKEKETQDDPNRVEETLRRLCNFCYDEKPLDPRIYEILKPGNVLLSWNKVVEYFDCSEAIQNEKNGEGFLCIVQEERSITTLWYVPTGNDRVSLPISFSLLEKVWIYRKGRTVLLAPDAVSSIKTYKFEIAEHAAKFENDILAAGVFCHYPLLRLSGKQPAQQLKCKWFLGNAENEKTQLLMIEKIQQEEIDDSPVNNSFSQKDFVDNVRRKTENFITYFQSILEPLIMWSSKFTPSEQTKSLILDLKQDIQTVLTLLPFFNEDVTKFKKSLDELAECLYCIENTVNCCQMMMECSEIYIDYFLRVELINKDVRSILDKCVSLEDESEEKLGRTMEDDLHKAVLYIKQMSLATEEDETSLSTLQTQKAVVDCIDIMCNYLANQRTSPDFPRLFDKLDNLLRVGNESVFDVLHRNFKKEMIESLLPLKKVTSIGNEMFGERPLDPSLLTATNFATEIRLSELQDRPIIENNRVSFAVELNEAVFCAKVTNTIVLFESSLTFVEKGFGFKKELWMKLLNIRTRVSDLPRSNTLEEENVLNDAEVDVFSCPRSWETYGKFVESEFQPNKTLGTGAYGEARLMRHDRLGRVVCKEFLSTTTEMYITREIDMLVRLQGNKNIVRLYGFYYSSQEDFPYVPTGIVMEHVELTLHRLIHSRDETAFKSNYSLKTALEYVVNMASGFAAMHALGFYHRDINPKNILLTYDRQIRICDFGTCGDIPDIVNKKFQTGELGTHPYKSPEMLNVQGNALYSKKTDVYSLAITIWELIHRRLPYTKFSNAQITSYVCTGRRPLINDSKCPKGLKDIIERAWTQRAATRPTMLEIQRSVSSLLRELPKEVLETKLLRTRVVFTNNSRSVLVPC